MDYDVLVVGSGIGGMESALKLGDMGFRVLLVEREASVGGKMILLSKVFPTLDCASCISTPKMAATIHHPNITTYTYSEVDGIQGDGDGHFRARITRKARFVDEAGCTGCQKCETACTVAVPDQFNADLVARRAAYIAFPQAVPKKAVVDRAGSSPCSYACPAGIQAHGYVSLIRSGEYEKAFQLVLEATPLAGTLGRACYAPCEVDCTRGELEGTLPIRRLKRFVDDVHHAAFDGPGVTVAPSNGRKVAIVGSGPAGVTAAWQLARQGYGVKIFEAAPEPGGFLRLAIPAYRLPADVVARDIKNVTDIGVEIATSSPVDDLDALRPLATTRSCWPRGRRAQRASVFRARIAMASWAVSSSCATSAWATRLSSTGSASWSSAAATWPWMRRGPRGAWEPPASPSHIVAGARRCPPTGPRWRMRSARAFGSPSWSPHPRCPGTSTETFAACAPPGWRSGHPTDPVDGARNPSPAASS